MKAGEFVARFHIAILSARPTSPLLNPSCDLEKWMHRSNHAG
jgi:transposase